MIEKNGDIFLIAMLKAWPESRNATTLVTLINQQTSNSETKANVNFYILDGNTALAVAARKGFGSAVEQLLDLRANPNATNWAGKSGKPFIRHKSVSRI